MKIREWVVLSSDGLHEYTVRQEGNRWFCSCPSFRYHSHTPEGLKNPKRRFCKHILKIKGELKNEKTN